MDSIQSVGNYVSMCQWFGPIISDKPAGPGPDQKAFEIRHSRKTSNEHDHVSNAMKELHWLKVQEWIQYKVLVTMYQCVSGLAPSFLTNLLDLDLTRKHFRSDTQGKLPIPHCSLSQVCNSSIRYAAPRLWNELPQHIWGANSL